MNDGRMDGWMVDQLTDLETKPQERSLGQGVPIVPQPASTMS